jgi:hypothetical protein
VILELFKDSRSASLTTLSSHLTFSSLFYRDDYGLKNELLFALVLYDGGLAEGGLLLVILELYNLSLSLFDTESESSFKLN